MEWKNERELQDDLAGYLRDCGFLTFTEILMPGCEGGRVDIATVKPHMYATKDLRAYEVKLTKQCFLQDIRSNKWHKYLNVFHRVYFAVPEGVIKKDEVPKEAGLIVRNQNGWHVVKAAKGHRPELLNADAVFALLYRGYEQDRVMRRLSERINAEENIPLREKALTIGHEIAHRLKQERITEIEEWANDIASLLSESLGIELKYDDHGVLRLPSQYHLKKAIRGIGEAAKEYRTVKLIGEYLYGLGDKFESVSKEQILEVINS
ncbi:MAG: MmcB family DNA repair protein [Caulobacteraceae bacterium]